MSRTLTFALFEALLTGTGCATGSLQRPPATDDAGIECLARHRMAADARLCRYAITVAVYGGGTARLEGKVSGEADRRRAEKLTRDAGATGIDDRLIMDPAAGEPSMC